MERPSNSDPSEHMRRPELDPNHPVRLFSYARDMQQWLRNNVSEYQLPDAIDHLANKLEHYLSTSFDSMPELAISSSDIHYTREIRGGGSHYAIESGPLPRGIDDELPGDQEVTGTLFGFHRGDNGDIRTYVSVGEGVRHFMGGIYTPLLSVGIETSSIELIDYSVDEKFHELDEYIRNQLHQFEPPISTLIRSLLQELTKPNVPAVGLLHESAQIISSIAREGNLTQKFTDILMDMISLKLRLDKPQNIITSLHREVITQQPVASYKAKPGPTHFIDIENIQLGLIGETANKGLGLFFLDNDAAVQIPAQYITNIYKSVGN